MAGEEGEGRRVEDFAALVLGRGFLCRRGDLRGRDSASHCSITGNTCVHATFCIRKVFLGVFSMAALEANDHDHQRRDKMLELLRLFLDTHHLGLEELAGLLRITPQTLEEWFSEGMAPPAAFLALAVSFDAIRHMSRRDCYEQRFLSPHRATQAHRAHDEHMLRMVRAI